MAKRQREELKLSDLIKTFIKENNLGHGMEKMDVRDAWYAVMGQAIEAYTDAVEFKNGTLLIRLSSAALRSELSYGKTKIIANINEYLRGDIIKELVLV